jgi:hypothetical protein
VAATISHTGTHRVQIDGGELLDDQVQPVRLGQVGDLPDQIGIRLRHGLDSLSRSDMRQVEVTPNI